MLLIRILIRRSVRWFLGHLSSGYDVTETIALYKKGINDLLPNISQLLSVADRAQYSEKQKQLRQAKIRTTHLRRSRSEKNKTRSNMTVPPEST